MRQNGILLSVSSLPSEYGVGNLGKGARTFIDFLHGAGQTLWQVLPIHPTSYGDSPYQSFSAFAGNPYFIDPDALFEAGWLSREELLAQKTDACHDAVDYGWLYEHRHRMLRQAFSRFDRNDAAFRTFLMREGDRWLSDYSEYMALKNAHGGRPWYEWEPPYRRREAAAMARFRIEAAEEIAYYAFEQFCFFSGWQELRRYAAGKGIRLVGDMPIYMALDSADVWASPENFQLDAELRPSFVAGCPPDAFSETGQLWGNPLYDWDTMKKDGFRFWIRRMTHAAELFDILRIDHFRGFADYYAIPAGDKTAERGKWRDGPGMALFRAIREACPSLSLIAEDLGFLTPKVKKLLSDCGYPGIKVLEFAFDPASDSDYLPHNIPRNCVIYTGTHDNSTVLGWAKSAGKEELAFARDYLRLSEEEGYNWGMIRAAMSSCADICILQMQDLLGLDDRARMNTPGTLGNNWRWRVREECLNPWLSEILYQKTALYRRLAAVEEREEREE